MCPMFLAHLWWLQNVGCMLLVGVWTVLPVSSRGCCGFGLLGCQLCPSYGCSSCCSIQAVIHPGGTGSSGRWHSRWRSENLEKYFDILPKCPSSFTRALASNGEGELITALQKIPAPRESSDPGCKRCSYYLKSSLSAHSTSLLQLAVTSCMCCWWLYNWLCQSRIPQNK